MLLEVGGHEALQRTSTERAVGAQHRDRHKPPTERARELVSGHLAAVEALWEVPQRPFATTWLVHGAQGDVAAADLGEIGEVRAPRHAAEHLDVTASQRLGDHRLRQLTGGFIAADQFIRGQT